MKVLITTDWYLPAVNGVVTSVINLQRYLEKRGVEVKILTLSDNGETYWDGNVLYLASVNASRIYPGARAHFHPFDKNLLELIAWDPDIVHSQCEFSTFLPARRIAKACGCPQIHTYHTLYEDFVRYISPNAALGKRGAQVLTKYTCRRVDRIIAPTAKTKDVLERYGIATPVTYIPTGICLDKYSPEMSQEEKRALRESLGIGDEEKILMFLGRMAAEKRPDEILSMFARADVKNCRLMFVGDGPFRPEMEALTERLGVQDKVIFTGMIDPRDVPKYYMMGDVFVSASRSETQGLTYIEAMASGLPLLCRKDPCLDGVLIPGVNGFDFTCEEEFDRALRTLLGSEELMKKMGRRSRELASEKFSAEAFGRAVLRVYRAELGQSSPETRRKIYGTAQTAC